MKMSVHSKICPLLQIIILTLLWIHTCSSDPKLSDNMKKMKAVKDKILNGYDKSIRPTPMKSNQTKIATALIPRQLLNVDEEKGLFELDSFLYLGWEDPRLKWDLSEYNGFLQLPSNFFWLPDVVIFNSHTAPIDPTQNVILVYLYHGGEVTWVPPIHTSTRCPSLLDVAYPGDVVTCAVWMGTWTHRGWEVDLNHDMELITSEFLNIHSRWELLVSEVKVKRETFYDQDFEETLIYIEALFPLRRKPLPEIEVTRSPCILVMLLSLVMFWMPPDSPNKLTLGGISLLSLITLLIYVSCSTRFPMRVLITVSFLQSTMYIVAVSILLQVLVIFNLCNITGPARPPAIIMQLLSGPFGKFTFLRSTPSNDNIPIDRLQLKEGIVKQPTPNEDWILLASGLDRLFFVLMLVSMVTIHHV